MNKTFSNFIIGFFSLVSIALPLSVMSSEPKAKSDVHAHEGEEDEHGHDHDGATKEKGKQKAKVDEHGHAEDGHDHDAKDQHTHSDSEKGHGEQDEHGHEEGGHAHGEEGEHEEGGSAVGPEKGITEANEKDGFKLSPEALKNFGIKTVSAQPGVALTLPRRAIFFGLKERNLFRVRNGFFKRIDFATVSKSKTEYTVKSSDLQPGDQVVIEGVGFLRIAELAATGGVGEGHSH